MITEEDIHRYHMTERVFGPPLPALYDVSYNETPQKAQKASESRERGASSYHV